MANSFALPDNGVVLQTPRQGALAPQLTLTGGGAGAAAQAPGGEFAAAGQRAADMTAKAMDALNQMTQGALRPYVEKQQRIAYFDGMARAQQGEALADIRDEQPWYTKIFGPSATVQGAQFMTILTALSEAQSAVMQALPELRKQGPDAMRQFLVEQAASLTNTGDWQADGLIQQKLAEQWGPTLKTHMAQHLAWQQEDMGEKFVALQLANGSLLQTTLTQQDKFADTHALADETDKFTDGLQRPPGMRDESWSQYLHASAKGQLHSGNFAAYEAMKAQPEVWQAISPEARQALADSEPFWREKAAQFAPSLEGFTTGHAKFAQGVQQGAFTGTEAQLHAAIDHINETFRQQSGASAGVIDNKERGKLVQAYYAAQARQASAWQQAQQGVLDAQAQQAAVLHALNSNTVLPPGVAAEHAFTATEGYWREALAAAQETPETLGNAIKKLMDGAADPKKQVASLRHQLDQDAQGLLTTAGGGEITPRQLASLGLMATAIQSGSTGVSGLSHYIGAELSAKMQALVASGVDLGDAEQVAGALKGIHDGAGAQVSREDINEVEHHITEQSRGWWRKNLWPGNWLDAQGSLRDVDLSSATRGWLAQDLAPRVAQLRRRSPGLSLDAAVQTALAERANNLDLVDSTLVLPQPGQKDVQTLIAAVQKEARSPIAQTDKRYQTAVTTALHRTLRERAAYFIKAAGAGGDILHFDPKEYEAIHGEQMGQGNLMLTYQHKKTRRLYSIPLTARQVLDQIKADEERAAYLRTYREQLGAEETWQNIPDWQLSLDGYLPILPFQQEMQ